MEFGNKRLLGLFSRFVTSISPKDRVAVIHHTDPDGVCSGVIVAKMIERLRGKRIDLRHNQRGDEHGIAESTVALLKKHKINKVILTDLSVDDDPEGLLCLSKFADVLVLDHHPIRKKGFGEAIILKPQTVFWKDGGKYPASKFVYDLANLLVDVSDLDWVAGIGVIGDASAKPWKNFLRMVCKKRRIKWNNDLFRTPLGKVASFISAAECISSSNVGQSFAAVYSANGPSKVLRSPIRTFHSRVKREIDFWLRNLKKKAELHNDLSLIFYFVKQKFNIKSPLSTIISFRYPHRTVITVAKTNNVVSVSARRRDCRVNMNYLLLKATKGFSGCSAGGHAAASAARFPKKYYKKFKKRLINLLQKR